MPDKLPKGWVKTTLGEVCAMNPRPSYDELPPETTEVSFVPMAAVEEETGRLEASSVRPLSSVRKGYTPFRENDVIFAKITPCMENGKIAEATGLSNGLAYGSTEFFVFRPEAGLFPRFVLHYLLQSSFRNAAAQRMAGAVGQKRVPANYLVTHPFPLPPTREQERIVAKLDALFARLDAGEKAARRALERLERYRAAVLHAAVTGELTRAWRKTHKPEETGAQLLQRLLKTRRERWEQTELARLTNLGKPPKDDKWKKRYPEPVPVRVQKLPSLPQGWMWASLDQLGELSRGKSKHRPRDDARLYGGPYPFVQTGDIRRSAGTINRHYQTYSEFGLRQSRLWPAGTLCITIAANIAESGILTYPACFPDSVVGFIQDEEHLSVRFIEFFIRAEKAKLEKYAPATAQKNINLELLQGLAIPLPHLTEQEAIVRETQERLASADRVAATLQQQLDRARATRQSILREAFAGKLVPQNPDDEPASALLDRIRAAREAEAQAQKQLKKSRTKSTRGAKKETIDMNQRIPTTDDLEKAWQKIGKKADARKLFEASGFAMDQVVDFYRVLRASSTIIDTFKAASKSKKLAQRDELAQSNVEMQKPGRFRLVSLWLEDFKNLKDYEVRFDPTHGLDIVLGWNGTGKSNLFEALVIIFRDLHYWWEKNKWPDEPMTGYRLRYQIEDQLVEVMWTPSQMKRPELVAAAITSHTNVEQESKLVKREDLLLPRFVFGYYSGPTNRLADHFWPMKRDHYDRLRKASSDDPRTLARLLEQRRFFCAEASHAKYVLLAFSYKEDSSIRTFLEKRLRIVGFESALFVIRKPRWAKGNPDDFWGATGIMRRVMQKLQRYAVAPMVLKQKVADGYRLPSEELYYFFLPDLESLQEFAAEYSDARSFFLALESTDFSELIYDVKIQVRVKEANSKTTTVTFRELSEGEQQLLMVLGLMRFTKSHQSLILLDEPDTHLNPHWSVEYLKDLASVVSDDNNPSPEQQTSQLLMATHDPLVIASLVKDQIHLLKRDTANLLCYSEQATVSPKGLGFTGILTSEMFGFRSDLDPETLADLDNRVRLISKEAQLSESEKRELEGIDRRLAETGLFKAFSDPYYAAFVRAWGKRYAEQMAGKQILTKKDKEEIDRIAKEILVEAVTEVEKEVAAHALH